MRTRAITRIIAPLAAALVALACLAAQAHAGGLVLKVEDTKVYVDLGAKDGLGPGSKLILFHLVVVKDPVSGKTLRDRFPIGELEVLKAGEHLALAAAPQDIKHRVKVGDEVELGSAPRAFNDPWQDTLASRAKIRESRAQARREAEAPVEELEAAARAQAERNVAEAEVVRAAWSETLGKAPAERIAIWERLLASRPETPYRGEIAQEIQSLKAQIAAEEQVAAQLVDPAGRRAQMRLERLAALEPYLDLDDQPLVFDAHDEVYEGTDLSLSFTVLQPGAVGRAWLYYRRQGDDSFQRVDLVPDGDAYLRATIPGSAVQPPRVDYFVEIAQNEAAPPQPVLGSQEQPLQIKVQGKVEEQPPEVRDRSRVTLFLDYVDFDGSANGGFDQYVHAEADFMYRFFSPVYAVRVGFGTIGGIGGPTDVIDNAVNNDCIDETGQFRCRRVSYSYAYTEFEYRFSRTVAFMLRPQFGTGTYDNAGANSDRCDGADTTGCEFFSSFGLRARLRIGDERSTNLTLGAGVTQGVGVLLEGAYTWGVIPQFPIKLAAQVTDQPVPEDFGVRLIADVGWRAISWIYPSVRLAYQARDVDHAGVSGGMAVNFDW